MAINFNIVFLMFDVYNYFFLTVKDLRRRLFLMERLEDMLEVDIHAGRRKYLPTINLFDVTSVLSWRRMRIIVRDYG